MKPDSIFDYLINRELELNVFKSQKNAELWTTLPSQNWWPATFSIYQEILLDIVILPAFLYNSNTFPISWNLLAASFHHCQNRNTLGPKTFRTSQAILISWCSAIYFIPASTLNYTLYKWSCKLVVLQYLILGQVSWLCQNIFSHIVVDSPAPFSAIPYIPIIWLFNMLAYTQLWQQYTAVVRLKDWL